MNILTLSVSGMSCMGCVNAVKNLLGALPGVDSVEVDLSSGRVAVTHDPVLASAQSIRQAIEAAGYAVVA